MEEERLMTRALRVAYVALAWLFVAGLAATIFTAGLGLFEPDGSLETHVNVGWILHLSPILLLLVALVGRVGRPAIWWLVALVLLVFVQPLLPGLRDSAPWAAALHPLNATLITFVGLSIAIRSLALLSARREEPVILR
jgi:hypothetical protein